MEKKIIEQNKNFYIEASVYKIEKNIYITSDEEIKQGDWYYSKTFNHVVQCDIPSKKECFSYKTANCKKIIATTDSELKLVKSDGTNEGRGIIISLSYPRPSNSFIEKFVSEWNADRKIDKVLVEIEKEKYYLTPESCGEQHGGFTKDKIKLALDNTITIKQLVVKDNWDDIIQKYIFQCFSNYSASGFQTWLKKYYNPAIIKQNL